MILSLILWLWTWRQATHYTCDLVQTVLSLTLTVDLKAGSKLYMWSCTDGPDTDSNYELKGRLYIMQVILYWWFCHWLFDCGLADRLYKLYRWPCTDDPVCRPWWLSWMRRPTGDQEVAGSAPAKVGNILSWRLIMKYFLRLFSPFCWFKKNSCQFLAKECAQYWLTA